jgi:thiamine-phosphate pyrophosphorylase
MPVSPIWRSSLPRAAGTMASDRRPIFCLITDRRRLCATCDADATRRCLLAQVQEAVASGIDLVQIRERDISSEALADLVSAAAAIARGSATKIIVNDRVDVAVTAGADGVHLRADSVSVSAARRLVPDGFLIGRSVHDAAEAASAAADADYLIAGTVFPTASKPGAVDAAGLLGAAGLADVVRAVRQPVLAIGGMTLDRLPEVAGSGAAGIAAIGLFLGENRGTPCRAGPFRAIVEAARARFDRVNTAP